MPAKHIELVIIDPQNDFCKPESSPGAGDAGFLYVKGAEDDMGRLSDFIKKSVKLLDDINITLDSHHLLDIAHPTLWRDSNGNPPSPFTIITKASLDVGQWQTTIPALANRVKEYVNDLEAAGRYPLCIWPPHCLIGTPGQAVFPSVIEAANEWAQTRFKTIEFVVKGSNPLTEHYSAVKAEVPDPNDPSTAFNTDFVNKLMKADEILIAGEARSHCVANTFRDAAEYGGDEFVKKMVFLEDCSSDVPSFEQFGEDFMKDMTAQGMKTTTTVDYLA